MTASMTASSARHAFPGLLAAPLAASLLLSLCGGPALAQTAPPPPEVTAILVQAQDVPLSFEYAGRVTGSREVEVRARVGGILLERTYVEGSVVKQGDVLFRLDPEPYRVKLARAEAQLRQEQARLLQADRNWKRIEPLFQRETVSGRERDEALSALDLARASVAVAEAEVRAAKIDLDYTQVKAPVSGVTSRETMSEGSLVDTGNNGLLTNITQLDPVYVNFAIPDAEATIYREEIAQGTVTAPADGHLPVDVRTANGTVLGGSGQINYTDSTVDPRTGTIRARAVVANPGNRLLPGQFVRAVVKGMTLKNAIAVPQKAVMQGPQGTFVYVVPGEGAVQAQIRPVKLGRAVGDRFIVAEGLKSGDRLITEGVIKVRPGATVKAVPPATPQTAPAAASPAKEAAR